MSGHSHWASIKHQKAATDNKRGKIFSTLSKAIMVAARKGSDPDMNFTLRHAIGKAREASMPRENIDHAIKKGAGELPGQGLVDVLYEGYAQGGVAILVEALTDNKNRTLSEIRKIFESSGGKLGSTGAVNWMFTRKGILSTKVAGVAEDKLLELALDAGADDVTQSEDVYEITCTVENFQKVKDALEKGGIKLETSEIIYMAANDVPCELDVAKKVLTLMERLEDHDDVQNVHTNMQMSSEVLAEMRG